MDETDRKILDLLKKDSRASFITMGRKVRLSEAAVRRRIKNLVSTGVIKSFTVETDPERGASAITLLSVDPSIRTSQVSEKLRAIQGMDTVYEITGSYEIAAVMSGENIAQINLGVEEIRRIEGVASTNTMIILKTFR